MPERISTILDVSEEELDARKNYQLVSEKINHLKFK